MAVILIHLTSVAVEQYYCDQIAISRNSNVRLLQETAEAFSKYIPGTNT